MPWTSTTAVEWSFTCVPPPCDRAPGAATVDGKTIDHPVMLQADKMWALAENVHNALRSAGRSLA
jgi:hypothetical protein